MNWKELKDFCNGLTEEQLEKKVILLREEEVISEMEAQQLVEDYYIDETGVASDGCFEESTAKDLIEKNPDDYPNGMDHFNKVYDKGFPLIQENF